MEKIDARRHSPKTQFEIRKQVIRLRKQAISNKLIAEGLGITERTASRIWQRYLAEGESAIKLGRRGRRKGEQRKLTAEQESEIKKVIIDKTPDQLKLPYALWTREAIQRLIKQQYKLNIPIRTITDYLKRWGFTFQKPAKQAYEQRPEAVQKWLDEEYPAIKERAKHEKAEIYWGDETGIQNDAYQAKGFAPKGKTPIIKLNVNKSRVNMISAISNRGLVRFMLYEDTMTAERLIQFMFRLIKDANRKVYLILDNLRTHHSKNVKQWLEKNKDKIEVFYLPSYSPELNPDEYLNGDLKRRVHSGIPARTLKDLKKKTRSFMKTLQRRSYHVKNYFKHDRVSYAA
jgi:transposase